MVLGEEARKRDPKIRKEQPLVYFKSRRPMFLSRNFETRWNLRFVGIGSWYQVQVRAGFSRGRAPHFFLEPGFFTISGSDSCCVVKYLTRIRNHSGSKFLELVASAQKVKRPDRCVLASTINFSLILEPVFFRKDDCLEWTRFCTKSCPFENLRSKKVRTVHSRAVKRGSHARMSHFEAKGKHLS